MLTHVVVTVYTNHKGKVVTHAYGPYTASRAAYERKKIIADHWWLSEDESLQVTACKMLDVDKLNRELDKMLANE